MRSRHVFPRNCTADLPVAAGGDGVCLFARYGMRVPEPISFIRKHFDGQRPQSPANSGRSTRIDDQTK